MVPNGSAKSEKQIDEADFAFCAGNDILEAEGLKLNLKMLEKQRRDS